MGWVSLTERKLAANLTRAGTTTCAGGTDALQLAGSCLMLLPAPGVSRRRCAGLAHHPPHLQDLHVRSVPYES